MPETITETMIVRDLALRYPWAREKMESLGIDYCCGGRHTLKDAAAEKGIDLAMVVTALNRALSELGRIEAGEEDWSQATLSGLMDHILDRHHAFLKVQMPRLKVLLGKISVAHQKNHGPLLQELTETFSALKEEIDPHLVKEEKVLFPSIRRLETDRDAFLKSEVKLINPIRQMEMEHETAGRALAKMRDLTSGYELPADACPSFAATYDGLKAIEGDLHEHIHLENNILFPKALAFAGIA